MNASGSAGNLVQSLKNLMNEWEVIKSYWHDVKSQEFERNYLDELPQQVASAVTVMEELDQLLKKIRSDCE